MCLGVAEQLPFFGRTFDLVLMVTTICFVDDIRATFLEALRVLRRGGLILIGFVDKESHLGKLYQARRQESKFYSSATFYSTEEVLSLLTQTGFRIERVRQTIMEEGGLDTILEGYGKGAFVAIEAKK